MARRGAVHTLLGRVSWEPGDSSLSRIWKLFKGYTEWPESHRHVVDAFMAAAHSIEYVMNDLSFECPWLFFQGPPGRGKSLLFSAFTDHIREFRLGCATKNAFVSGADSPAPKGKVGRDESLIPKFNGRVVTCDDFQAIVTESPDFIRQMGQLRMAYGGTVASHTPMHEDRIYKSRFILLAGVTDKIEEQSREVQHIGQRFLTVRVYIPGSLSEEIAHAMHALTAGDCQGSPEAGQGWSHELRQIVHSALDAALPDPGDFPAIRNPIPGGIAQSVVSLAVAVCRLRSYPSAGGTIMEPEGPARLTKQLTSLMRCRASLDGRTTLNLVDLDFARRVAWDTVPRTSALLIRRLLNSGSRLAFTTLRPLIGGSERYARSVLEQLVHTEVLSYSGGGRSIGYSLDPEFQTILLDSRIYPHEIKKPADINPRKLVPLVTNRRTPDA